jgi:uncharacterized cupredoxin-like copper-binding protein
LPVLVYALTTGHKVGLGVTAACFIVFALASSFLFPRFRSTFPGRGLPAFMIVSLVFFFGMLTAVEVFGAEPKEKTEAEGQQEVAEPTTETTTVGGTDTTPNTVTSTTASTTPATTQAAPSAAKAAMISVRETEFKIVLPAKRLRAGKITFAVKNVGRAPHNLVVEGNGLTTATPIFNGGESKTLKVSLKPGRYELYCSVPGHKQAGMDLKVTVTR